MKNVMIKNWVGINFYVKLWIRIYECKVQLDTLYSRLGTGVKSIIW